MRRARPRPCPCSATTGCSNVEQCDGIENPDSTIVQPVEFAPLEACERIVSGYPHRPAIEHGGVRACYRPATDTVRLPQPERFTMHEEYYATLFHELAHSTGHSRRLDRGLDSKPAPFGSPDYGREELIAEMAAAFLSAEAGIAPATLPNAAAYLQGWLTRLKQDKKLVIQAAGAAQRAADWMLDRSFGE